MRAFFVWQTGRGDERLLICLLWQTACSTLKTVDKTSYCAIKIEEFDDECDRCR